MSPAPSRIGNQRPPAGGGGEAGRAQAATAPPAHRPTSVAASPRGAEDPVNRTYGKTHVEDVSGHQGAWLQGTAGEDVLAVGERGALFDWFGDEPEYAI